MDQYIIEDAKEFGISVEELQEDIDCRWYQVKTYDDLLKLNIEFINGKIERTPYHWGPLHTSSQQLIDNLVELHHYGILTVNGQESLCNYNIYQPGRPNIEKLISGYDYDILMKDHWTSVEQRGYLCFYVNIDNIELAKSLIEQLHHNDKNLIYKIIQNNKIITNMPEQDKKFNLTRISKSLTPETKNNLWEYCTNFWRNSKDICDWGFITCFHIEKILENTIWFEIALPEYGKGNLEEILLDMCKVSIKI
jgi:hypothetical protein